MAAQQQHRDFEESFGCDIRLGDLAVRGHHQDRVRQRVEDRIGGVIAEGNEIRLSAVHAAALQPKRSKAMATRRCTSAGSSEVRTRARADLSCCAETPSVSAAVS